MKGNLHFKIDWASLIVGRKFTVFALFYFVFEGNSKHKPQEGSYLEGQFNMRFFTEGLIFGVLRYFEIPDFPLQISTPQMHIPTDAMQT